MAAPTVGIDIGSNLIKVVEMRPGSPTQITAIGIAPVPNEALDNGIIVDPQLLGKHLKDLLKEAGVSSRRCVSSVSGQAVVVRVIELPRVAPNELQDQMKWEVEKHVPFAASEVIMDYQAIDRPAEAESQNMEVLLAVAQQEMIDRHVDVLRAAGLKPSAIDVEPLAVCRSLLDSADETTVPPDTTVAIVNIGASTTDIAIYRDRLLAFPRTLSIAGNQLTEAIARAMGVEIAQADEYKREHGEVLMDQAYQQTQYGAEDMGFHDFSSSAFPMPDFGTPSPFTPPPSTDGSPHPSGRMPFDFQSQDAPPLDYGAAAPPVPPAAASPPSGPFDFSTGAPQPQEQTPPGEFSFAAPAPPSEEEDSPSAALTAPPALDLPAASGPTEPPSDLKIHVFNAMAPVLTELSQEVRRSIEYFRGKYPDTPISELWLVGGTAKMPNLAPYIEQEVGVPTRVADPFKTSQVSVKDLAPDEAADISSFCAVAVGLAQRDMLAGPPRSKK